jgi:acyl carrier protein
MQVSVFDTIVDILVKKFDIEPEKINNESLLSDLGLDSLALMEFIFALEDAFKLRIPEDKLDPTQSEISLKQLSEIVQEALNTPQA